jgi:histidine triad (HIT) family protein
VSDAQPDCVFCRIAAGEIPSTQVHADNAVIAIRDLNPQAPVHVLVLPRRHVAGVAALGADDLSADDATLLARMVAAANRVARDAGIAEGGYRLVINQGADGGQTVGHLHLHVLGGRPMTWPPG